MRWWISHITLTAILGVSVNIAYAQPKSNPLVPKPSTDAFSKAFMYVYEDASMAFINVKGRKLSNGLMEYFECKKNLPGAFAGFISNHDKPICLYDFGSFKTLDEAEQNMRSISVRVANAFRQKALVKYIDSTEDTTLVKRTALAEMINGGFYGYNVHVDIVKKNDFVDENYGVELTITWGSGVLYNVIWNKEPYRSSLFNKSFRTIYTQFNGDANNYYCNEQLPGYTCNQYDSSGKDQLMMEKLTTEFRDARVEFEALTSNLRSMLGQKFVYYIPKTSDNVLMEVVFVTTDDFDKVSRKSISTSVIKNAENQYTIRLIMYHP